MRKRITYMIGHRAGVALAQEQRIINSFTNPKGLEVECPPLPAMKERSELVQRALHNPPTGVVELGISYIKDFIAMHTLQPFTPAEVRQLGDSKAFVEPSWQAGVSDSTVWAIPMFSDVRLVFYRRDLLEKAGCDEHTAFRTPENFKNTLQRLREAGVKAPWSVPTSVPTQMTAQMLASWIWYYGNDFLNEKEQKFLIAQPDVMTAIQEYFGLYEYLGHNGIGISPEESSWEFADGQAAVTISGAYAIPYFMQHPEIKDTLGIAVPFGCAFVGGSSVAIWRQTTQEQAALNLIEVLSGLDFQVRCHSLLGSLPARIEALQKIELPNETFRSTILQALETGRQLPSFSLWGLVEDRLANIFANLWTTILTDPKPNVNQLVEQHMTQASEQLDRVLPQLAE